MGAEKRELERKRETAKASQRGLRPGTDWRCEPSTDSQLLACRFTAVESGQICGTVAMYCADGSHTASVCTARLQRKQTQYLEVAEFAPPLPGPGADCTIIRFTAREGLGSGSVAAEVATVDEQPLETRSRRTRARQSVRDCRRLIAEWRADSKPLRKTVLYNRMPRECQDRVTRKAGEPAPRR
jgi:hypothetical protein